MSELILTNTIIENIISVMQKTHIFSKMCAVKNELIGFTLFASFISTTSIINGMYNSYLHLENTQNITSLLHIHSQQYTNNVYIAKQNKEIFKCLDRLETKIDILLQPNNIKLLNPTADSNVKDVILCDATTDTSDDATMQNVAVQNVVDDATIQNVADDATNTSDPDNELLSECYDTMPCNNLTKRTGINKLFNIYLY